MEPSERELESAIEDLTRALKWTPAQMRLLAKFDQIRAACRDDPEQRARVIKIFVDEGCELVDIEEWLDKAS